MDNHVPRESIHASNIDDCPSTNGHGGMCAVLLGYLDDP
jgi:hypothetical protein